MKKMTQIISTIFNFFSKKKNVSISTDIPSTAVESSVFLKGKHIPYYSSEAVLVNGRKVILYVTKTQILAQLFTPVTSADPVENWAHKIFNNRDETVLEFDKTTPRSLITRVCKKFYDK